MCGIAGIVDTRGQRAVDTRLLNRMSDALVHRGPDGGGTHIEPGVAFAHRRLSIIDLSSGAQPMFNEDGTVVATYNGEIYNYKEIRAHLAALGHTFRTHSDTEVLVHGWEQWGSGLLQKLRGMFAFALWDRCRRQLMLARDPLGIKPLYYAVLADGWLLFASELKGLLVHPGLPRELDDSAVEEYFAFGYVPEPKSILRAVSKLPPASIYTLTVGEPVIGQPKRYWQLRFEPGQFESPRAVEEELVERLGGSVSSHMVADVPVGAFLSGGVDSSAVVAMMARASIEPIRTCSISFAEQGYDESHYARIVASRYRTNHNEKRVGSQDFAVIDRLPAVYDEPFADSSALPTYRVCELARREVKVVLSGDGGDENFAGYRRYRFHRNLENARRCLPQMIRGPVVGLLARLYPKLDWAPRPLRAKASLQALARPSLQGYLHLVSCVRDELRSKLYSAGFHKRLAGYRAIEVFERHATDAPRDALSMAQYLDFMTYLPGDILTKVDRASMAHGLEVRVPILDHKFVEWVATIPPDLKLRDAEGKYVLKRALAPYLDAEIMYRAKMGFTLPLLNWFRGPLRTKIEALPTDPILLESGVFDVRVVKRMIEEHISGRRNYTAPIWSLLMFRGALRRLLIQAGQQERG